MVKKNKSNDNNNTSHVYIASDEHAWIPARLKKTNGNKAVVSVVKYDSEQAMLSDGGKENNKKSEEREINLKDYPNHVLPMQNVDGNGNLLELPDMVNLPFLHEAAILYNLKYRHVHGKPYTRTGDIVMAVNPYQWFDELYTESKRAEYSRVLVWENKSKDKLEPHVYEASALAYKGLAGDGRDQSILVSGESGAGKTETVKICMNHIASVQRGNSTGSASSPIVERILDSNPLLEAFGNAKTRRNDNSSRFGKYLQLQFDDRTSSSIIPGTIDKKIKKCLLAGSKCEVYLLEKNRVVCHDSQERTFHIFYQLLASSNKQQFWKGLKGTQNESFAYVGPTDTNVIEGMKDGDRFQKTVDSLALVNIKNDKLETLMRAICIVLQLGNVVFCPDNNDGSAIKSKKEFADLAELMGVSKSNLTKSFTERTVTIRSETCTVPLNQPKAKESSDALAKEIYGKSFLWLVKAINEATCAEKNYQGGGDNEFGTIGLLDIFGFESFPTNRFEQLCINYANEKLQQKFNHDIFRSIQAEYEYEGLDLAEIKFDDNTDVLDLIEGKHGLLAMLNEECVRPKGSDGAFVNKALAMNKASDCLIVDKMDQLSFGIRHYAGKVMYDSEGFVTSNADTLPTDLKDCAKLCANSIVANEVGGAGDLTALSKTDLRGTPKRGASNIVAPTVWSKYKGQLQTLMADLAKTQSRYIRCIKPNTLKKPKLMEHDPVVEQLRCAGVVAAVTLARSAFPNRLENSAVRYRYSSLWDKSKYKPKKKDTPEEQMRSDNDRMLTCALKSKEVNDDDGKLVKAFAVGKTRTYFRAGALEYLEANRTKNLDGPVTEMQRVARGYLVRRRLGRNRAQNEASKNNAAVKMQEWWRMIKAKKMAKERVERLRKKKKDQAAKKKELEKKRKMEAKAKALMALKEEKRRWREEKEKEYKKESARLQADLDHLNAHLKKVEKERKKEVKEAKERAEQAEKEKEEEQRKADEQLEGDSGALNKMVKQKAKLEAGKELIVYLRKENKKLRNRHELMKKDYLKLRGEVKKLQDANKKTGSTFEELNQQSKEVNGKNAKLLDTVGSYKKRNQKLREDLETRQKYYYAEAEVRLEHQRTLAQAVTLIQDKCKDFQLAEDIVVLALECEAFAKSEKAGADAVAGEEFD